MSDRAFRIGLLGHGTVGGAFAELLPARAQDVENVTGMRPEIAAVLTRSTCAPASDSWSTRITGTTPATAASKRSCTPCSRAAAHSSSPCSASSCLLAVTTCLPARIARRT